MQQFLTDKEIATEKELAPYLEQAAKASSVRWRAARARLDYLISSAVKTSEQGAEKKPAEAKQNGQEQPSTNAQGSQGEEPGRVGGADAKHSDQEEPEAATVNADAEKDQDSAEVDKHGGDEQSTDKAA